MLLVEPVFGPAYSKAISMLLILLVGMPFFFLFYAVGTELAVTGRYWTGAAITAGAAAINIMLNVILIPGLGGQGAAWASAFSYFAASIGIANLVTGLRSSSTKMLRAINPIGATLRLSRLCIDDEGKFSISRILRSEA
jgi:Na+-driven multidrug efflux pump